MAIPKPTPTSSKLLPPSMDTLPTLALTLPSTATCLAPLHLVHQHPHALPHSPLYACQTFPLSPMLIKFVSYMITPMISANIRQNPLQLAHALPDPSAATGAVNTVTFTANALKARRSISALSKTYQYRYL